MDNGLKIYSEPTGNSCKSNRIYLTTNYKKLIQSDSDFQFKNAAIFEIEIEYNDSIKVIYDFEFDYKENEDPFAFYVEQNISPDMIKLIK